MSLKAPNEINDKSVNTTTLLQLFLRFLMLGCTSFGGPVAHIGFFRSAFVDKLRWLNDTRFSDYLSLCQFIPGPASSQLGMAIGYHQKGYVGALVAWLGFTLPSAALLTGFALFVSSDTSFVNAGVIQGLKLVALAVVVHAFWAMAKNLAPDAPRASLMILSAVLMLAVPSIYTAPLTILMVGGFCAFFDAGTDQRVSDEPLVNNAKNGVLPLVFIALFVLGLVLIPWLSNASGSSVFSQFSAYFQAGALVFGGGHVVLPLLETEVLGQVWVDRDTFLAGYGAAQAVPGPLFTFASYLGAAHAEGATGVPGALLATFAIFLPSFLLLFAVLPVWDRVRALPKLRSALWGINAAVVGLLLAAIYDPIWLSSVMGAKDFCYALVAYLALAFWRVPPPILVLVGGLGGMFLL